MRATIKATADNQVTVTTAHGVRKFHCQMGGGYVCEYNNADDLVPICHGLIRTGTPLRNGDCHEFPLIHSIRAEYHATRKASKRVGYFS